MNVSNLNWPSRFPRLLWLHRECPLGSSIEFKTAESGAMDGPLSLFALSPIRCANCWRRYYWFSKREKSTEEGRA